MSLTKELREDFIQFILAEQPSLLREYLEKLSTRELLDIRDDLVEHAALAGRL